MLANRTLQEGGDFPPINVFDLGSPKSHDWFQL